MSSSAIFIGTGFYVTGAQVRTGNVVRVTFSSAPKLVDPTALNDALNPLNYSLAGPGPGLFSSASIVVGDTLSVDLWLTSSLVAGIWSVNVNAVVSSAADPLTAPTAATFTILVSGTRSSLSGGAQNDSAEQIIRKHLSSALGGPNWDAVIKALATGDDVNWTNAQLAVQQLFLASASGKYLIKRASDQGLTPPSDVGMGDSTFRRLAIKTANGALLHTAIKDILEVYYGADSSRAFAECTVDELYDLNLPGTLSWILDGKQSFYYDFPSADFGNPGAARAVEVAFALTQHMRQSRSNGFAVPYRSPGSGLNRVRIYSGSMGRGSSVQITGGRAQNIFRFSETVSAYSGSTAGLAYNWAYSLIDSNTTRASLTVDTSLVALVLDLSSVHPGDYVAVTPTSSTGLSATYSIKKIRTSWSGALFTQSFDIDRVDFTGAAIQLDNAAYTFYRPKTERLSGPRTVAVTQSTANQIDIILPATAQVVERGPKIGAYLASSTAFDVASVKRLSNGSVTITTAQSHGLGSGDVGRQILLDTIKTSNALPYISPGNGAALPSTWTYDATHLGFVAAAQTPPSVATQFGTATTVAGDVIFVGGKSTAITGSTNHYIGMASSTVAEGSEADGSIRHAHTWATAASLTTPRHQHAASEYAGDLMVSGGLNGGTPLNSIELYDTSAHTWSSGAALSLGRNQHRQVTLNDGRVLVMGGYMAALSPTNTTEIYDGAWIAGPSMIYPRADFQAVKLSDGRVLAIGGGVGTYSLGVWTAYHSSNHTCEIFDGANWRMTGSMGVARGWSQAIILPNDYVLVVGGLGYPPAEPTTVLTSLASAEIWSPITERWSRVAAPFVCRHSHLAGLMGNRVVVLGGESFSGDDTTVVECFDVATRTWSRLPYKISHSGSPCFGAVTPYGELVFSGGTSPSFEAAIDGLDRLGGVGLNRMHSIVAVPSTTSIQVQTTQTALEMQYATSYGVTIQTGTVTAVGAQDGLANAPGPYMLDPTQGAAVTAIEAFIMTDIFAGQQYKELTLNSAGAAFPLTGYVVLGFGSSQQTSPIRYLDCYQSGPMAYKLVLDFAYHLEFDFAAGAQVILLSQKAPYNPEHGENLGLFYLTASSAGRVAAQQAVLDAVASGVDANIEIVYPGDTGLGGARLPTHGTQKVSDIATVFAGDEVDSEVQARRKN